MNDSIQAPQPLPKPPEHLRMLRVTKGAAHDVPELTNAGKVADEVLVDTSQSTPQVGAIMVA